MAGTALAVLAIFVVVSLFSRASYLVLANGHTGVVLLRQRAAQGDKFSISYIHSVNKSPVAEIYQIRDGEIVLIALEFETFGAGMPGELEPGQSLIRLPGGGMRIEGFDRVIGELRYMIGHDADIAFSFEGRQTALGSLDAPGQPVRIAFEERGFWQRFLPER